VTQELRSDCQRSTKPGAGRHDRLDTGSARSCDGWHGALLCVQPIAAKVKLILVNLSRSPWEPTKLGLGADLIESGGEFA
jgi:hypothetical protein